jgi:Zn-dependent M28 family amino/carboxypeptidase
MRSLKFLAVLFSSFAAALAFWYLTTQPFVQHRVQIIDAPSSARLEQHVKVLSRDFYPRSFDQSEKTEKTVQYIADEFKRAGATVTFQTVKVEEATYQNVIASFGLANGPLIVFGAHYDSHGDAIAGAQVPRGYTTDSHTPGADDNASGVAGLLELAHMLGKAKPTELQNRSIQLVAYSTEEPPHFRSEHMGSEWHAKSLKAAKRDVRLMISLEMIGYFSDAPDSQTYPIPGMSWVYSDRGDFVAIVGKLGSFDETRRVKALMVGASPLKVFSINATPFIPGIDFSDHMSYWHQGYPALMITDTSFMRNPNYHKSGDTFDKLDYKRMAQVVQGAYSVAVNF